MHVQSLRRTMVWLFSVALAASVEAGPAELEKELRELQAKIESTKQKITDTRKFQKRDAQSDVTYRKQNETHAGRIRSERDSLAHDYRKLQAQNDNLSRQINGVQARQREIDGVQSSMNASLLQAADNLRQFLGQLPPGSTARAQLTTVEFLRSEIVSKSIENMEAIERLWQVHATLDEMGQSIDVFTSQSPTQEVQGQVDFLQIGLAYLAFVNTNETYAAVWTPSTDSAGGSWQSVKNPAHIHSLRRAIKIRQGNSVPELMEIPFQHKVVLGSTGQEGAKQ